MGVCKSKCIFNPPIQAGVTFPVDICGPPPLGKHTTSPLLLALLQGKHFDFCYKETERARLQKKADTATTRVEFLQQRMLSYNSVSTCFVVQSLADVNHAVALMKQGYCPELFVTIEEKSDVDVLDVLIEQAKQHKVLPIPVLQLEVHAIPKGSHKLQSPTFWMVELVFQKPRLLFDMRQQIASLFVHTLVVKTDFDHTEHVQVLYFEINSDIFHTAHVFDFLNTLKPRIQMIGKYNIFLQRIFFRCSPRNEPAQLVADQCNFDVVGGGKSWQDGYEFCDKNDLAICFGEALRCGTDQPVPHVLCELIFQFAYQLFSV